MPSWETNQTLQYLVEFRSAEIRVAADGNGIQSCIATLSFWAAALLPILPLPWLSFVAHIETNIFRRSGSTAADLQSAPIEIVGHECDGSWTRQSPPSDRTRWETR